MSGLAEAAIREVIERHEGFVTWFTGVGDASTFVDIERSLGPQFTMVGPCGTTFARAPLIDALRAERGKRAPDFAITVDDARVLWEDEGAALVTYVECQTSGDGESARRSTALFVKDDGAPCGVHWQRLQETWITTENGD